MSKKSSGAQVRSDTVPLISDSSAPLVGAGGNDLQQIQDLLFGAQARQIEGDLQQLEDRFNERLEQMSRAFEAQIEQLSALLIEQVGKERSERLSGHGVIVQSVNELRSNLNGSMADLSEMQQQARREVAEELQVSSGKLAAQMALQNEQLSSQLQQGHSELDDSKLSKKAMAKLLNELAAGV